MNVHELNDLELERQIAALKRMIHQGTMMPSNGVNPLTEAEALCRELEDVVKQRKTMKVA